VADGDLGRDLIGDAAPLRAEDRLDPDILDECRGEETFSHRHMGGGPDDRLGWSQ